MNDFKKKCVIVTGLVVAMIFLFFWFCPWRYEVTPLRSEGSDRTDRVFVVDRLLNRVSVVLYSSTKKEYVKRFLYSF